MNATQISKNGRTGREKLIVSLQVWDKFQKITRYKNYTLENREKWGKKLSRKILNFNGRCVLNEKTSGCSSDTL